MLNLIFILGFTFSYTIHTPFHPLLIQNTEAAFESRKHEIHTEWKLNESVFHFIRGELEFSSTIDLFAIRIIFPPFACLPKTLEKIYQDKAKNIQIVPDWPSQPFYPRLIEMSLQIISIPPRKINLYLPSQPPLLHPLHGKLSLLACLVDGAIIN